MICGRTISFETYERLTCSPRKPVTNMYTVSGTHLLLCSACVFLHRLRDQRTFAFGHFLHVAWKTMAFLTSRRKNTDFNFESVNPTSLSYEPNHNQNARTEARRNTEDSTRNCAPSLNYRTFPWWRLLAALYVSVLVGTVEQKWWTLNHGDIWIDIASYGPQTRYMNRPSIQCIFSANGTGESWPSYHFCVTSCRTDSDKFCTAKIKQCGQCC